ncbi:MAG: hypothetical protein SF172_03685 [Burkholderiales bacterium]|nr:hypothetical protein [Burkholderiales bacterium]
MSQPGLAEIEAALRASWSADTAWSPARWSVHRPAAGQCWSSAFVVRALLGGEVVHAKVLSDATPQQWHAWNRLPDGSEVDLTLEQFPHGQQFEVADFPESAIEAVAGPQAILLLARVRAALNVS